MGPSPKPFFKINYYHDYISPALARALLSQATPVAKVSGLVEVDRGGGLETPAALQFLTEIYSALENDLNQVLRRRVADRKFIDERVRACSEFNTSLNREITDQDYKTILGLEDGHGRVVIGPLNSNYCKSGGKPIAPIPEFLKGPHVTLFGPPDSAKMAINAMNAYHRKLKNEPAVVEALLKTNKSNPKWGADDEDSKTPLRADLVDAAVNLTACFDGEIKLEESGKKYELAKDHLSLPIKRFPGLALPCTFLFFNENPIPLHLYDFALHLFRNWENPEALVFYVPKLENEEEAKYIHKMISVSEDLIKKQHPSYVLGSVRLMIVLENPRAILRTHEIIDALHPYFVGASLGWHDYLASTARLFKEDCHYRIPVKADPDIVIKYIKASHLLLADFVGSRGGIKVGGMYGILPLDTDMSSPSFQITLKGFVKDVIIQMKRDLTGFWVAHPDFVRLGIALVEGWRIHKAGDSKPLLTLVKEILHEKYHKEITDYILLEDIAGLDKNDPNYVRALIVADIKESDFIANNDPEEIRYNVFQSLQYLTDWLSGNGCVALPAIVNGVAVRVMDDLATAERSRWEVWHEIRHGRFNIQDFLKIAHEEMNFIRGDLSDDKKIVQVKWNEKTEKWYPIAFRLMLQLMTDPNPVEFATELLMPFTVEKIRNSSDPWRALLEIEKGKYRLSSYVERFDYYFEVCGSQRFARSMADTLALDLRLAESVIKSFSVEEILEAASFHGNIGQSRGSLDSTAAKEQALVLNDDEKLRLELQSQGEEYLKKFGFKFLVSAKGKSGSELLKVLESRLPNSREQEIENARSALWEISLKRLNDKPLDKLSHKLEALRTKHKISGAAIALNFEGKTQGLSFGQASGGRPVTGSTLFELASLSKTIASGFAIDYFAQKQIPLSTSVNSLLARTKSNFRITSNGNPEWADGVSLENLMNHSALNMHYVNGVKLQEPMPNVSELIGGSKKYGYDPVQVTSEPGKAFHYSGGGFLVLEHLIESLEEKPIQQVTQVYLSSLGLKNLTFDQKSKNGYEYASGFMDDGSEVPGGRMMFPAFAAGALGSVEDTAKYLNHLTRAFWNLEGSGPLSHDAAVQMLHAKDRGCYEFMGCKMGLGVFVAEAGENKIALHQGANEGFRALYLQCFDGPDCGKGMVIFSNGDNRSVLFISEVAQTLLQEMKFSGIDFSKFLGDFNFKSLPQEQIVNMGYKKLLLEAFEPTLPEEIVDKGPRDPLADDNLAVTSKITFATDQKFARGENLISAYLPVFDPELFGEQGKIMDSWESVRHNELECDSLKLKLKASSKISYVSLSTKFHDGNHPQFVSLQAFDGKDWVSLLDKTKMEGHSLLNIALKRPVLCSEIQVNMYPDGGLSRLGLFEKLPAGEEKNFKPVGMATCIRFSDKIPKTHKPLAIPFVASATEIQKNLSSKAEIDLASEAFGGKMVSATNEHYGPAKQVVSPFPPINMFDGLESARSRDPGNFEEVVLQLAKPARVEKVVADFQYFVNNNPLYVSIQGQTSEGNWIDLAPKTKVKAFAGNKKLFRVTAKETLKNIRVRTYPDGGINRIKVFGA